MTATIETTKKLNEAKEPTGVVLVADVDTLTSDIEPGCGNDNPYN
ncbi:hypothetical protein [Streptomyces bluensis]